MDGHRVMRRILVAVDTSGSSHVVVEQAVQLARAGNAKIRLFHAVPAPTQISPPGVFVAPPQFHVQEWITSAEETLRDLEDGIPEELRDGIQVEIGSAADRVCETARTYCADLVVIGAHQYGLVARALGTTAARIVNRMDRPVFVVRPVPQECIDAAEPSHARISG